MIVNTETGEVLDRPPKRRPRRRWHDLDDETMFKLVIAGIVLSVLA